MLYTSYHVPCYTHTLWHAHICPALTRVLTVLSLVPSSSWDAVQVYRLGAALILTVAVQVDRWGSCDGYIRVDFSGSTLATQVEAPTQPSVLLMSSARLCKHPSPARVTLPSKSGPGDTAILSHLSHTIKHGSPCCDALCWGLPHHVAPRHGCMLCHVAP